MSPEMVRIVLHSATSYLLSDRTGGEDLVERVYHDIVEDDRPVPERLEGLGRAFAANFAGDRDFTVLLANAFR